MIAFVAAVSLLVPGQGMVRLDNQYFTKLFSRSNNMNISFYSGNNNYKHL